MQVVAMETMSIKKAMTLRRDEAKEKRIKRAKTWEKKDAKATAISKRLARANAMNKIKKELCTYTKNDALTALRASIQHWQMDIIKPFKQNNTIEYVYSYQKKHFAYIWKKHDPYHKNNHYQNYLKIEQWHCALCSLYAPFCQFCPLQKITGNACVYHKSIYTQFINELNLKTAKDMVNALICAYWALIDDEL
jgi:hypothetical protein